MFLGGPGAELVDENWQLTSEDPRESLIKMSPLPLESKGFFFGGGET